MSDELDFVPMPVPRALVPLVYETVARALAAQDARQAARAGLTLAQEVRRAWEKSSETFRRIAAQLRDGPELYEVVRLGTGMRRNAFHGALGAHERVVARELGGFRLVEVTDLPGGGRQLSIRPEVLAELERECAFGVTRP